MVELGSAFQTVLSLIPAEAQSAFFSAFLTEFEISQEAVSAPAGAILMGMYVLEYAGFARHIDALLGVVSTNWYNETITLVQVFGKKCMRNAGHMRYIRFTKYSPLYIHTLIKLINIFKKLD